MQPRKPGQPHKGWKSAASATTRQPMTPQRLEQNFQMLVEAAIAGERCPQSHPHGPIDSGAMSALIEGGRIRSEVYAHNYRRVVILTGEHKGKATAAHPRGFSPYMVNGRHVDLDRSRSGWR